MNIVFIKHTGCNQTYLFEVPAYITLKKGEEVMVQTRNGETSGVCTCDSFELDGSPLVAVGNASGAKFPLKPVVGKVSVERFKVVQE